MIEDSILESLLYRLDNGSQRTCFSMIHDNSKVVKVCDSRVVQNAVEYDIWCSFYKLETDNQKWVAECFSLSDDGRVLIQERLSIFNDPKDPRLPKKVPNWLNTDLKVQNWGIDSHGNVKCCDYGSALILQSNPWKLKKAKWWSR